MTTESRNSPADLHNVQMYSNRIREELDNFCQRAKEAKDKNKQ